MINKKNFFEEIRVLFVLIIVAFTVKATLVEIYVVPTGSMENEILVGDMLIGNKFIYGMRTPTWVGLPYSRIGFEIPWIRLPKYKPVENNRFATLKPVERHKLVENTRFSSLRPSEHNRDFRQEPVMRPPMRNSRCESLKPIEKLPRESRRETFRQHPVEQKFEQLGSMQGMFSNLSVKPKQNKKKKKKKKKIVYEEEEETNKEDYKTTIQMLDNFYPKEESEEEDNSAW